MMQLIVAQLHPLSGCGLFLKLLITSALTSVCKSHVSLLSTSLWCVAVMLKCFDKKPLLSPRFCFYGRIVYPVGFKSFASCFLFFCRNSCMCNVVTCLFIVFSLQKTWNVEVTKHFVGARQGN